MVAPRSRTRLALLALVLLLAPAAAQQPVPLEGVPDPLAGAPGIEAPGRSLSVAEGPFRFEGRPESPRLVSVADAHGAPAFTYAAAPDGRVTIVAGGEVLVDEGTLAYVEGDPLGDRFTLAVRDADGATSRYVVDRAALLASTGLAPDEALPPIVVERPEGYRGGPRAPYLLNVRAALMTLAPSELAGDAWMPRADTHLAILQIPAAESTFDRVYLEAYLLRDGAIAGGPHEVEFRHASATPEAAVHRASYLPGDIGEARDDDIVHLRVIYEDHLAPLVVQRHAESLEYAYRLDGKGPSITLHAPAEASNFSFDVSWSGADERSGLGGFLVDWRRDGGHWTRWLDGTRDTRATFSGAWGTTYEFRAQSIDHVGNPSPNVAVATTRVISKPLATEDVNDAPEARFLAPAHGAALAGMTLITWRASDPDGAPVTSKLEASDDGGATWRTLHVGTGESHLWDTRRETDGVYRLRLTVTDGTLTAADALGALTIRNVLPAAPPAAPTPAAPSASGNAQDKAPGAAPVAPASSDAPAPDARDDDAARDTPGLGAVAALVAVGVVAFALRRRG